MSICPVIMAGGSGTRLWPLSRATHPKQFLRLHGECTMLQATIKRISQLNTQKSITICNEEHRFFVAEQLREIDQLGTIILEPAGRNTAPAIALAALIADDDPLLLVLPADHVIRNESAFREVVKRAVPLAEAGKLVTFGILPNEPHTGYGYIKRGKDLGEGFEVEAFVEKPSSDAAQDYFSSGNFYWNSGMFLFRASDYLEELKKYRCDILEQCQASVMDTENDLDFLRVSKEKFESCPAESIDYAVMEKTSRAVVVPIDVGWSDIGSWSSLWNINKKDIEGNSTLGDVLIHKTHNSYIRTNSNLVVAVGVDDLVIVSTNDAILVAHKDSVQDVKIVTDMLKARKRNDWEKSREVHRPWGKYNSIDKADGYQVKKLTVNPGAKLSVQMHYHRSEHWVVVSGQARVHYGSKSYELGVNESTYHGKEVVHALENPGDSPLELIEVQVGQYLGEDDIVRYGDIYGRT